MLGKPKWQPIHNKAMNIYYWITEKESETAQKEGRNFDKEKAIRELAFELCKWEGSLDYQSMMEELTEKRGRFLAELFKTYSDELSREHSEEEINNFLESINPNAFGPQLVVCYVIDKTYGRDEACSYALEILTGKALPAQEVLDSAASILIKMVKHDEKPFKVPLSFGVYVDTEDRKLYHRQLIISYLEEKKNNPAEAIAFEEIKKPLGHTIDKLQSKFQIDEDVADAYFYKYIIFAMNAARKIKKDMFFK